MKKYNSFLNLFVVAFVLMTLGFACNNSDSTTENKPITAPANTVSNASNSTAKTSVPTDISGNYSATGKNADGGGEYGADLVVTNRDDVYQFSWDSKGIKYDGVGVQNADKVAVSFTDGTDGKGCGVVLYKISPDGSLDGKSGYWGTNTLETETAKRTSGSDLEGAYDVEGKNPNGETYKAKLNINKKGEGYKFGWSGANTLEGFGVKMGDSVAVGIGGAKCSFVAYDVKSDGTLEGKWGGQSSTEFGTEIAKKK